MNYRGIKGIGAGLTASGRIVKSSDRVRVRKMFNDIIKIASDLIKFPTVASRPRARKACVSYIESFFRATTSSGAWRVRLSRVRCLTLVRAAPSSPRYDSMSIAWGGYRGRLPGQAAESDI